jgi:hypothetical protein
VYQESGNISPQYHLVYDEYFTTVSSQALREDVLPHRLFMQEVWEKLVTTGLERHDALNKIDGVRPVLNNKWITPAEADARQSLKEQRRRRQQRTSGSTQTSRLFSRGRSGYYKSQQTGQTSHSSYSITNS